MARAREYYKERKLLCSQTARHCGQHENCRQGKNPVASLATALTMCEWYGSCCSHLVPVWEALSECYLHACHSLTCLPPQSRCRFWWLAWALPFRPSLYRQDAVQCESKTASHQYPGAGGMAYLLLLFCSLQLVSIPWNGPQERFFLRKANWTRPTAFCHMFVLRGFPVCLRDC